MSEETNSEWVGVVEGGLSEVKEIVSACAEAGIEARIAAQDCDKPGCTPKMVLLVERDDVPRIAALMRERWLNLVANEGVVPLAPGELAPEEASEGDPPCPACGTVGPLVEGACSDCGLQLE